MRYVCVDVKISAYRFGSIEIEGKTYTSDVIISRHHVKDSWWRQEGHRLAIADLDEVISDQLEVLVVGTGDYGRMKVPVETRKYLESRGIGFFCLPTRDAVKEFNRLQQKYARIVAALHLTC